MLFARLRAVASDDHSMVQGLLGGDCVGGQQVTAEALSRHRT
jgi:hypothetical protein